MNRRVEVPSRKKLFLAARREIEFPIKGFPILKESQESDLILFGEDYLCSSNDDASCITAIYEKTLFGVRIKDSFFVRRRSLLTAPIKKLNTTISIFVFFPFFLLPGVGRERKGENF
jgi:hypothetical protein